MRAADPSAVLHVEQISDLVLVLDAAGTVRYISPVCQRLLGHRPAAFLGSRLEGRIHADDRERFRRFLTAVRHPGPYAPIEFRLPHADGSWRWLEASPNNLLPDESVRGIILSCRDSTERQAQARQLQWQAFYDSLTGVPNRALFLDRLAHALAGSHRQGQTIALLFVDLDGFKAVNDALGHGVGDAVLVAIGRRMAAGVRPSDTVARFGGDEFTILLEGNPCPAEVVRAAERLLAAIRQPLTMDGREICLSASIGAALSTPDAGTLAPDTLLHQADIALAEAKLAGKARVVLFNPDVLGDVGQRVAFADDLRQAMTADQLQLFYQPEIDLQTGRIAAIEALVRWQHAERGLLSPGEFIALAEEASLILPLGRWVLETACRQAALWHRQARAGSELLLGVNLSHHQLQQPDLVDEVGAILGRTGLPPPLLRLELQEGALLEEAPAVTRTLQDLRRLGVGLGLDDFGTGYSAVAALHRLPVDTLKIDRSLSDSLEPHQRVPVARAVTALGHALGMRVVAEGIETAEQLAAARDAGCDAVQGYYLARPVSGADIMTVLAR